MAGWRVRGLTLGLVLSGLMLVVGCGQAAKGNKPSADWSRSLFLGEEVNGSLALAVAADGDPVQVVWPERVEDGRRLIFIGITEGGDQIERRVLPIAGEVRNPSLIPALDERTHLVWAERIAGDEEWSLWGQLIDQEGEFSGGAYRISPPKVNVGAYEVEADGQGGLVLIWDQGRENELYLSRIDATGDPVMAPFALNRQGKSPSLQVKDGHIHAAWQRDEGFWYADLPLEDPAATEGAQVVNPQYILLGLTGDTLSGPEVGTDGEAVYVFWSIHSTTDTEAGFASTQYVRFPIGRPESAGPISLRMISAEDQDFEPYSGRLGFSELAEPAELSPTNTDFIKDPVAMLGTNQELVLGLVVEQPYRLDSQLQIGAAVFDDGEYLGYTMASNSEQLSESPVVAVDEAGQVYIAWREGAGGKQAYYATTDPNSRAKLDRLDAGDLAAAAPQGVLDMFASFAFMPVVGLCWLLPGLLLIGAMKLRREDDNLNQTWARVVLALGIVLYYLIKLAFLPTMTSYVPLSAWLFVPAGLADVLRVLAPLAIFSLAGVAGYWAYRRYSHSALVVYISFVAVDAILSLLIYGVNLQGVF